MRVDEIQHVVSTCRIHSIRGFIQKDERRVVHDGLRQFHALLHAGRELTDEPVALLIDSTLIECLRGSQPRGACRESADLGHVPDEIGGGDVGRKTVRFRHVAHELAHMLRLCANVEAEDGCVATCGGLQAKHELDERGFASAVRTKKSDGGARNLNRQLFQGHDLVVGLAQIAGLDDPFGSGIGPHLHLAFIATTE